jgi:hypothetical protein
MALLNFSPDYVTRAQEAKLRNRLDSEIAAIEQTVSRVMGMCLRCQEEPVGDSGIVCQFCEEEYS